MVRITLVMCRMRIGTFKKLWPGQKILRSLFLGVQNSINGSEKDQKWSEIYLNRTEMNERTGNYLKSTTKWPEICHKRPEIYQNCPEINKNGLKSIRNYLKSNRIDWNQPGLTEIYQNWPEIEKKWPEIYMKWPEINQKLSEINQN